LGQANIIGSQCQKKSRVQEDSYANKSLTSGDVYMFFFAKMFEVLQNHHYHFDNWHHWPTHQHRFSIAPPLRLFGVGQNYLSCTTDLGSLEKQF